MAQRTGCTAARRLPRVQSRRPELTEEVGDGQRRVPPGNGVGEHGEVAFGRRHLGPELLGSQPRRHRDVRDHVAHQPPLAQRWGVPRVDGRGKEIGEPVAGRRYPGLQVGHDRSPCTR